MVKKRTTRIIKPKHFRWTVKYILQFNDNLDLTIEGVGIKPARSHACGIWDLPAWQQQKAAWSVVKQTSPARPASTQMTLSLNLPLISIIWNLLKPEASQGQTGLGITQGNRSVLWGAVAAPQGSVCCSSEAREQWGRTGTGRHSWPPGTTGLGHKACPAQLLRSSRLPFAALQWHGLAGPSLTFLSFSTCRKETEKTQSNPLRSLF